MFVKLKTVVLNDTPKCRSGGCPRWIWCSAVRPGRGSEFLSQSESATPKALCSTTLQSVGVGAVQNGQDGCPECL
ncbi:MAG: hypothetical protein WC721_03000 [Victivallaceae bacterium]